MKKILLSMACLMAVLALSAQSTAKKFVLNLTADGESNLTCYLPQNPSGRAVVDCPGGGYSHLALNHEGYDWAEYFNKQGIAFFVLKYRMPHGRHTVPMEDACKAMRTGRVRLAGGLARVSTRRRYATPRTAASRTGLARGPRRMVL